mmetsp:Transcript_45562/g.105668  ORF Transcript_45562/g.105668 Transcript_45562/m.105668 type:complete len:203 (+) Transcript_45562:411-1019(+)
MRQLQPWPLPNLNHTAGRTGTRFALRSHTMDNIRFQVAAAGLGSAAASGHQLGASCHHPCRPCLRGYLRSHYFPPCSHPVAARTCPTLKVLALSLAGSHSLAIPCPCLLCRRTPCHLFALWTMMKSNPWPYQRLLRNRPPSPWHPFHALPRSLLPVPILAVVGRVAGIVDPPPAPLVSMSSTGSSCRSPGSTLASRRQFCSN